METHRCNRDCRRHGCVFPPGAASAKKSSKVKTSTAEVLPLYYLDQNQSQTTPYSVTREQADKMKGAGRGKFIYHHKAFQLCEPAPAPRHRYVCSESPDSTASISLSEMQAFAGVPSDTPGSHLPRHIEQRARQKVNAIGRRLEGTFDAKAPLAFGAPSWPVYEWNAVPQMEA
jgi:hypothetical protein